MISRRSFLAGLGAGAATLVVQGCSSDKRPSAASSSSSSASVTTTTVRQLAGDRPDPSKPEGVDTLPQVEHIVVVMMENHSYDNYLGMLGRADGFTRGADGKPTNANPDANGQPLRAFHMANTCQLPRQPSQAWNASHQQYADGAMSGFVQSDSGPVAMGYWTGDDIPFYYSLASTFPVCDRWFASCLAQTFPNRRFLIAATALGTIDDDLKFVTDGPQPAAGTIMDLLNKHSISWRDYYTSLPTTGLFLPVLNANGDKVVKIEQFFTDAAAGTLPAFSLVEPDFNHQSEENSEDITVGEKFTSNVVNAVMSGPKWSKTLLIWCYDEHGGYYDHVPPPVAVAPDAIAPRISAIDRPGDYARYGFRVPAAIVSPYAKREYVSHVVHDHTSILKLVERKFNLPALTNRDAAADDLLDSLDFDHDPAFLTPPPLAASHNTDAQTPLCTVAGAVPNPAG
ncbi:MAG TPA: alkaline phosphatase family protein [Acidimicrobiales bacterium]|nr:alkaline phosphatase family protein [Acidimicrobiales bacterium]